MTVIRIMSAIAVILSTVRFFISDRINDINAPNENEKKKILIN